jgi:transposase-like protein
MPKPSKLHRSAVQANADSGASLESRLKRIRRRFTAAEKLRIVQEASACTGRGEIEALLRREGIYSSHLSQWRQQLAVGGNEALKGRKPGRKPKLDAKDRRIQELERKNAYLKRELLISQKLIELQKKAHEVLGIALPQPPNDEDT